jgi:hypothetical protein
VRAELIAAAKPVQTAQKQQAPDSYVRLGRLPNLAEIIVEDTEARNDETVILAFFPGELGQRRGVAGAIGQRNGFVIEATGGVGTGWLGRPSRRPRLAVRSLAVTVATN